MLLDMIAKLGLLLGFPGTYAVIIIIGFLCFNRKIFGTTLFLLFFTMIYNYYLKSIWQMPLPPPLEGWAFPSGHTHSAVIFWGWLAYQSRSWAFSSLAFLFIGLVGFGLVHDGYHYAKDVYGAVGFGLLSLFIYYLLNRLRIFTQTPYLLGVLLTILSSIIMLLVQKIQPHLWQALGGLIGFTVGWFILEKQKPTLNLSTWKQKASTSAIAFFGIGLIALIFYALPLPQNASLFGRMLCITLWVSTLCALLSKLKRKNCLAPSRI